MPTALTDIERRILDYMVDYLRSNTYQPSIREIGERFGIKSTKTSRSISRRWPTRGSSSAIRRARAACASWAST
jgi:repressor LexA